MATAVAEQTDLAKLRKRHADAETAWQALANELRDIHGITSVYVDDKRSAGRAERLRAAAREPDLRRELTLAEAEVAELEGELRAVEDAARQRLRAEFRQRKAPVVKRLAKALASTAAVSRELADIEHEEVAACGGDLSWLSWPELGAETPTEGSRFVTWRRFCKSEGFDIG